MPQSLMKMMQVGMMVVTVLLIDLKKVMKALSRVLISMQNLMILIVVPVVKELVCRTQQNHSWQHLHQGAILLHP